VPFLICRNTHSISFSFLYPQMNSVPPHLKYQDQNW